VAALVETYREAYDLAEKNEKKEISLHIVAVVMEKGRFLKKSKDRRTLWSIVANETARVKVAQALQYRRRRYSIPHESSGSGHQDTTVESFLSEDNSDNSSADQLEHNVLQVDCVSLISPMVPPGHENELQQMEDVNQSHRSTPRSDVRAHEFEPVRPETVYSMPTEITFAMERLAPAHVSMAESSMHILYSAGHISDTESLDWRLQDTPDMAPASADASCSSTAVDTLLWELL
jgi:hypothetical protein